MQNPPRSDKPLFFIQVWPSRKGVAFDMTEADADLTCRAVNNHESLCNALRWALEQLGEDLDLDAQAAFLAATKTLVKARQ